MGNTFSKNVRHTIRNCVAWKNKNQGFYANHSPGGSNWYNNTSYNNGCQFDMFSDSTLSGSIVHVLRNNIACPKVIRNMQASDMAFNSWDLDITPTDDDFAEVSDSGWMGPRKPDGNLPDIPFLKLDKDSRLLDKETDIGLAFTGVAPDLGAYEYNDGTSIQNRVSTARKTAKMLKHGISNNIFDLCGRRITSNQRSTGVLIHRRNNGVMEPLLSILH